MNTGISMRRNNLRRNPHEKNIIWEKIAIITASAFIIFAVLCGFAPIFPDTCYHLTHYWPAAADIPVASDN
ncbi:hypothetical protein, partial [Salmonella enterica]